MTAQLRLPCRSWSTHVGAAFVATVAAATLVPGAAATAAGGEPTPTFRASEVLPDQPLSGPSYVVENDVRNDGFLNIFRVTVDGERHVVFGNALMRTRLQELAALEKMKQLQRSDVYTESLKTGVTAPLRTAEGLITEPVETVEGIASGVGSFFSNVGHSIFGGASEQEEGAFKTALGLDVAKRKFAYEYGIDPYTSFPPVRERLNEVAWAAAGGSLTVSAAFQVVPGPASLALSTSKTSDAMRRLIRDTSAADLKEINAKKLKAMGVDDTVAELFLEHPNFSPTNKTFLVDALARVGASNRQVFIERAILAQSETLAFFLRRWAEMIAAYHVKVQPAARFVRVGRAPFIQRVDGVLVGLVPVDYLAWTADIAGRHATNMRDLPNIPNVTGGEIWIEGGISPKARAALEAERWVVKSDVGQDLDLE